MEFIKRSFSSLLPEKLNRGKAIILTGPRQVGKTTLLEKFAANQKGLVLSYNCDDESSRSFFSHANIDTLKLTFDKADIVIIDEAQRVKNIGLALKLITDRIKHVQLIVTGSSSFDLSNEINETLTGRKFEYQLLPISCKELIAHHGQVKERSLLHHRLVYGSYPDVINNPSIEIEVLRNLSGSYLYKDILSWQEIRKPELLDKLLKALAFQTGSEVSYHEIGQVAGCDSMTATRYIDLLEKAYVIFRLPSFSRNVRNELKKSRKIYFFDNGIRNAIIGNFSPVENRTDIGALWENYLVSERIKTQLYSPLITGRYFWRTTQQQEIDYLEESQGKIKAFEFKWNPSKKIKAPLTFGKAYPESEYQLITSQNYMEFIME